MENQDIQPAVEPEIVETSAEPEQVEQAVETEQSKPAQVPLAVKEKAIKRAQEAERKLAESERRNAALEQERNLQQLIIPQGQDEPQPEGDLLPPDRFDYSDHNEYVEAQKQYNASNREKLNQQVQEALAERDRQHAQTQSENEQAAKREQDRVAYLERADKLEAGDFLEKEAALKTVWSPAFIDAVSRSFPNSEQVNYAMGGDLERAKDIAKRFDDAAKSGNLVALTEVQNELVKYAADLGQSKQGNLPEPDEPLTGGSGGVVDVNAKIDQLRQKKLDGKITMQEFMDRKRELESNVA